MTRKERYDYILQYFREQMPEVQTELEFGSVFQLLVAVILSAQCTDKRINQVTPELFRRFPDAKSMAQAEADEVLEYIKSVSYPNSKAEHLVKMARIVAERFDGEVPSDMNQLLDLPGVGRKTANVIQSVAFGKSHPCVPCQPSLRTCTTDCRHALSGRTSIGKKHTRGRYSTGTSLVIVTRTLCLHVAKASLREVRPCQRLSLGLPLGMPPRLPSGRCPCHPFIIFR